VTATHAPRGFSLRRAVISTVPDTAIAATMRAIYPRMEPELARLGEYMPRGGTAVDVGVWFGPWCRRMTRYADRVVAIEAHPELVDLLRRSVPGVDVVAAAASDIAGEIELFVPAGGPFIGVSSVERGQPGASSIAVASVTIDSLDLSDVRFMKLDVEGHELAALRGAASTVRRDRPLLLVELEERMQPVREAVAMLDSWGYHGWVCPGRGWIPLADFDLVAHQRAGARRLSQSLARRAVWQHPRYVNMVLFRPDGAR
jgi:FkbM family methyltransferase